MSELDTADAALLDTLLREAPIGFALFGPDLCFRRVNETLARLYGHDPEDHIGQMPSGVWPAGFAAKAESSARRVLAEDEPVFGAHQFVRTAARVPGQAAAPAQAGPPRMGRPSRPRPPTGRCPGSPRTASRGRSPASC